MYINTLWTEIQVKEGEYNPQLYKFLPSSQMRLTTETEISRKNEVIFTLPICV